MTHSTYKEKKVKRSGLLDLHKKIILPEDTCKHLFTLGRIETEQVGNNPSSTSGGWYQKVAYVICEKCGEVRSQII